MEFGSEVLAIFIIRFLRENNFNKYLQINFLHKSADIAICDMTKSSDRFEVADLTISYYLVPLTFITLKPGLESRNWIIITPFSINVWVLMGLSFMITSTLIQVLYKNVDFTHNHIDSISISLIAALLQQCEHSKYKSIKLKIYLNQNSF